jgi:hypothetical protein
MKNLHKFYNREELPRVQLILANYYANGQVLGQAKKVPSTGRGSSIIFWQDLWNEKILSQSNPHLYSFTNRENITMQSALQLNDLQDLFHLPFLKEAYTQLCELHIYLHGLQTTNEAGQWKYI